MISKKNIIDWWFRNMSFWGPETKEQQQSKQYETVPASRIMGLERLYNNQEEEQQQTAPKSNWQIVDSDTIPLHMVIKDGEEIYQIISFMDYLENIKPFCRMGADIQEVNDDFHDFSGFLNIYQKSKFKFQK